MASVSRVPAALLSAVLLLLSASGMPHAAADVEVVVANNAQGTAGGQRFDSVLGQSGVQSILSDSIKFVLSVLYSDPAFPSKDVTRITFSLDNMDGVAYTSDNGIHLSASYVAGFGGDVVQEIKGVLYHEMTHVWQWNGRGAAPGGLIEGVADFVRLRADLAPSHWVKAGEGDKWDQGYDVTARFLDYCDSLKSGFVAALNAKMADGWSESYFNDLLGKSVQDL